MHAGSNDLFKECSPHGIGLRQHTTPICLSAYPRLLGERGSRALGVGLVMQTSRPPLPVLTVERNNTITHAAIILALLFNYIFKVIFKYVNHPHIWKQFLLETSILFSMTCL